MYKVRCTMCNERKRCSTMTNEEYYRRWAAEYERSAEVIKGNIDKLKEKAKTANYKELQSIGDDISTLTASLYDCRHIMAELLKKAERERIKGVNSCETK